MARVAYRRAGNSTVAVVVAALQNLAHANEQESLPPLLCAVIIDIIDDKCLIKMYLQKI